jgi:hypothetical protein
MKQVIIKATYKPRFEIGRIYSFINSEAEFLVSSGYADYVTEVKAPKIDLNELQTDIDINSQVEDKKPVKRTKKSK